MIVLSLFDGISCARVALERAGIPVHNYYASEVDKYAIEVTKKNRPNTIHIGDVKTVGKQYQVETNYFDNPKLTQKQKTYTTHDMPKIDLLIGGSPCQDLSIAKKNRKGLDGERSGLFWEYVRILKETNPKRFILENVASMPKEAKAIITEALGVEPIMINAALLGAQTRKRLFRTNIPNVVLPEQRGIMLQDIIESGYVDREKSLAITASYKGPYMPDYKKGKRQIVFINQKSRGFNKGGNYYDKAPTISSSRREMNNKLHIRPVALRNRGEGKKPEYNGTDKANSLTTVQTDSMVEQDDIIRKLTPIECERLQGLPDDYSAGISNTQRYKCLGNAFNVDVITRILSFIPR